MDEQKFVVELNVDEVILLQAAVEAYERSSERAAKTTRDEVIREGMASRLRRLRDLRYKLIGEA